MLASCPRKATLFWIIFPKLTSRLTRGKNERREQRKEAPPRSTRLRVRPSGRRVRGRGRGWRGWRVFRMRSPALRPPQRGDERPARDAGQAVGAVGGGRAICSLGLRLRRGAHKRARGNKRSDWRIRCDGCVGTASAKGNRRTTARRLRCRRRRPPSKVHFVPVAVSLAGARVARPHRARITTVTAPPARLTAAGHVTWCRARRVERQNAYRGDRPRQRGVHGAGGLKSEAA